MRVIEEALDAARTGSGQFVTIVGEPGIGKSRLVDEAASAARARSFVVLAGRSPTTAGAESLRPVAEIVVALAQQLPSPADELAGYQAVLSRLAPHWGRATPANVSAVVIGDALLRMAAAVAPACLLTIEDAHWADPDTLAVLEYVAEHVSEVPVSVLVTMRSDSPRLNALISELTQRGRAVRLEPARLSPAQADQLASACLDVDDVSSRVREIVAHAEGLPLLVEDLLADADANGTLESGPTIAVTAVPRGFAETVERRLTALNRTTQDALRAAAVVGRDIDGQVISSVADLSSEDVTKALREADTAQIVEPDHTRSGGVRFRHALTRDAILATLSPADRQQLAARAARAMYAAGAGPGVVARLHADAGEGDRAARLFLDAASEERIRGTLPAAIDFLSDARACATDAALAGEATVAHLSACADAGRVAEAEAAASTLLPYLSSNEASDIHRRLAAAWLRAQDSEIALRHLDAATLGTELGDDAWAEIWALRAEIALAANTLGRVTEAEHLAQRAVAAAERSRSAAAQCEALLVLGRCARLRDLGAAEVAFARAREAADGAGLVLHRVRALAELGTVQMLRDVRSDTLAEAHHAAVTVGDLVTATSIEVNLAGVSIMRGELAAATARAQQGQVNARRLGMFGAAAALTMFEGISRGMQGDRAGMERLLAEAARESGDEPDILAGSWAIGRATLALLDEDRESAVWSLRQAEDVMRAQAVLMIDPAAGPHVLLDAVTGSATTETIDEAERRSGTGSAWTRMWVDSARAVMAGAAGQPTRTPYDAAEAAARKYPVFGLVARRLTAEAALRDGWAVPDLSELGEEARDRGYPRVAAAVRDLQRSTGAKVARRRAVDDVLPAPLRALGITAREAEVLSLLADRLTNPELAARLYLSPRTVEKHVASLLLKTGADGRSDLARIAADPTTAPLLRRQAHREGG